MANNPPIVLSIAGSDSSGGAGVQGDLRTFDALGAFGATVITSLTAQNTTGVKEVHHVPFDFVRAQMQAVFSDVPLGSVKTGMLGTAEIAAAVADELKKRLRVPLVVDPVLQSSSGQELLSLDALDVLRIELFPLARVITPNFFEAALLLSCAEEDIASDPESAAASLLNFGSKAVLLTGGDAATSECVDYLCDGARCERISRPRIASKNLHGTGCVLSSAIAVFLAQGQPLEQAVQHAKDFTSEAISRGISQEIGKGSGPLSPRRVC